MLTNATGRFWRIRPCPVVRSDRSVQLLAEEPVDAATETRLNRLEPGDKGVLLAPGRSLTFCHEVEGGERVQHFLELIAAGEDPEAKPAAEGFLFFVTYPTFLGLGPDATTLEGSFYPTGRSKGYGFIPCDPGELLLVPSSGPALPCIIL